MTPLSEQNHALTDSIIMMVDDEPINNAVVQIYLEEEGYHKFVTVDDSVLAMSHLEETRPDLLLLDLMMPEVSGFEILTAIRSHPKLMHLPVIILTASTDTENKLKALDLGATDFLAKPLDKSELGLRVRNTLRAKAYLDQLAYYDPLTKLPNRQLFFEELNWAMKGAKRYNEQLSLLNIELDNFDIINDTIGVDAGDEVLQLVSQRIQTVIRDCDILGRIPGDEDADMKLFHFGKSVYSLLLYRMQSIESSAKIAGRIIEAIRAPIHMAGNDLRVTASIGIASAPAEGNIAAELLRLASSAKDFAKKTGGDTFKSSSEVINKMYSTRMKLESRLHQAVEKQEFVLHYQPKVEFSTGAITGVEALVRWNSDQGFFQPLDFIPLAEETGLIIPLGEWCLVESCRQLKEWQQSDRVPINMAVNLSAKQFGDTAFMAMLKTIISNSGIDTQHLTLELTESLLIDDVENKIKSLESLRDMGLKLSIDDFGTGFSSLSYLKRLPLDELKIDRSFITNVAEQADSQAIVSSIVFLANKMNLKTVAEGVEKQSELEFMQKLGCDQYQGYIFSHPLPADQLFAMLPRQASV